MKCPECEGVGWYETAVGELLQSFDCDKCEGAGEVPDREGDERDQPHRDSGLPNIDTILEWQRLK